MLALKPGVVFLDDSLNVMPQSNHPNRAGHTLVVELPLMIRKQKIGSR